MKHITKLMVSLLLMVSLCISASACNVERSGEGDNDNAPAKMENQAIFNEYEWYKEQNTHTMGFNIEPSLEYIELLRELTEYSRDELIAMNYSAEKIEIVEKMKEDDQYIPSDEELSRAGATLRFTCVCSGSRVRDNNSWYDFIWSFRWSDTPLYKGKDIIAFHWVEDFSMDENSVEAEISYQGGGNTYVKDLSEDMRLGIIPNKKACSFKFPVKWELDNSMCALSGSGSFRMSCNDHRHQDINMGWAYGKIIKTVSGLDVEFGNNAPTITFGDSIDTWVSGNRTFYITD